MKKLIKELAELHGPSGFEQPVIEYITKEIKGFVDEIEVDLHGNIIARKKGAYPGPKVIITAHMDEVGFIVRNITEQGLLKVESLGGHDERNLPGQKVQIRTDRGLLTGIFGGVSAHYRKFEQEQKLKKIRESYIDVGVNSKEEAEALGITIGNPVTWLSNVEWLGDETTGRLVGKGFDDRAGCAILIKLLEEMNDFRGEIIAVFTVQEEIGLRGARIVAESVKADLAIAIDTTAASDTQEAVLDDVLAIGKGTGIKVMDFSLISHPAIKRRLIDIARELGIPFQLEVFPGIGTDGGAMHLANNGIPTGVLSIPSRNAHSPIEVIDLNDVKATKKLLKIFIASLEEKAEFRFIDVTQ
ncbi:M42 family metallopeptidase [Lederbergia panacisoli]|uniref:M42 family metallopeptidase n=1 Tax=Lederbergia panacisoli TaxID=1255251 RepID=UPI00214BBAD8|nr:M42 family metallopeptidase [Lederbergia panacisoli]MCR2821145.1 M42 family metallopeptidase [Lederbergia panacisoli]